MIGHNEISDAVAEITRNHNELTTLVAKAGERATAIGQILIELQPTLKAAGSSITKLCEELPFNKTTAYDYMNLARGKTTWEELYDRKKSSGNSARAENLSEGLPSIKETLELVNQLLAKTEQDSDWKPNNWLEALPDVTMAIEAVGYALEGKALAERTNDLRLWKLANETTARLASIGDCKEENIDAWLRNYLNPSKCLSAAISFMLQEFHPSQDTKKLSSIRFCLDIEELADTVGGLSAAYMLLELVIDAKARDNGCVLPDIEATTYQDYLREALVALKELAGSYDGVWEMLIDGYKAPNATAPFGDNEWKAGC